jgi:hypothetical protein
VARASRIAGENGSCVGPVARQPIKSDEVRDHQHWHIENRDRVRGAQLARDSWKTELDGVVVVEEDVGRPHEIEGDDEEPKERTYSDREKGQQGQNSGCKVTVGGERGEASRQIGADDAGKNKDEPEEAEAVYSSDDAVRFWSAGSFVPVGVLV